MRAFDYHSTLLLFLFSQSDAFVVDASNHNGRWLILERDSSSSPTRGQLTQLYSVPRREFVANAASLLSLASSSSAPPDDDDNNLLLDAPMTRLKLPRGGLGREYVAVPVNVNNQGPFDFMLDTGLTTEFITPHLQQQVLSSSSSGGSMIRGLAAGGSTASQQLVELPGVSVCSDNIKCGTSLPLPLLHAVVTDFPQEHIDPNHDPVEGMLGMEVLSMFDVDLDFPAGRVRFWKPGTAASANGMVTIPAVVINETGLIGIRLATPQSSQPILGFLDCGSSFTALNWLAASTLGMATSKQEVEQKNKASVVAVGIDGRPITLPTVQQEFSFRGDVLKDSGGRPTGFAQPPTAFKQWDSVQVAIGDLPAFSSILGDGVTPYKGPAALIGLDILAQRRVIFQSGPPGTRQRRVLVGSR